MVPSQYYAPKNKTVNQLLEAMVQDINALQEHGIEAGQTRSVSLLRTRRLPVQVPYKGQSYRLFVKYLGNKGDWPWLRSSMGLATGFKSHRICHLCSGQEPRRFNAVVFRAPRLHGLD